MNILIIEDETLAAERLEEMLFDIDKRYNVLAKIKSVDESVKWLVKHRADLIFLDIQLSDGMSFSIFDHVIVNTPIIFTTAYDQYAVKAFQLNSIAYLLKPIRKNDLISSLQKLNNLKQAFFPDIENLLATFEKRQPHFKQRFLIRIGEKLRKIEISEIAYFFVKEGACFVKTFNNKNLLIDYTLDSLDSQLNPAKFFRINRKYIVNMDAIENMVAWSRSRVKLELNPKPDDHIDTVVSIERSSDFKLWLDH